MFVALIYKLEVINRCVKKMKMKMKRQLFTFVLILSINLSLGQTDAIPNSNHQTIDRDKTEKVEVINKSFDQLVKYHTEKKKDSNSIWDTLIPLLIGAGLTLLTQFLMDYRKTRKEKNSEILLTRSELEKLKHLLNDNYRELAMHKAHKFYWYAHYQFEIAKSGPDPKEVDKFYNSHMNSSAKARDTENKISANFAEYCKLVSKLQHLTNFNDKVNALITEYQEFKPAKPLDLLAVEQSELYDLEREEEDRLFKEYQKFISIIKKINKELE